MISKKSQTPCFLQAHSITLTSRGCTAKEKLLDLVRRSPSEMRRLPPLVQMFLSKGSLFPPGNWHRI